MHIYCDNHKHWLTNMDKITINEQPRSIYLDEKVFASLNRSEINILKKLIDMQPLVASKEVLLSSGWPGRVVGPNSLNMAIKSIRTTLDTLGVSDIIITVPKEGFRLSENVKFLQVSKDNENEHDNFSVKESSTASTASTFKIPLKISLALLTLFSLVIFKLFLLFNQPKIDCKEFSEEVKACVIEPDILKNFNAKNKSAGTYALGRSYEAFHTIKEVKIK